MTRAEYQILPFWFRRLTGDTVVLTNQAGEFGFVRQADFRRLVSSGLRGNTALAYELERKQFISSPEGLRTAVDLLATKLRTRKGYLRDFTSLHVVVVTGHCNFACRYCQACSAAPEAGDMQMSPAAARAVVDTILQTPSQLVKIEFQGGEPLLNWPAVKEIVLYAARANRKLRKRLEFVLCTNLTLLDTEKLAFLGRHNVAISTSLDGPRDLHDKHRVSREGTSGYDVFREKLALVQGVLGPGRCSALLTITKDHLNRLPEVVDEYISCSFEGIFFRAINPYGSARSRWSEVSYRPEEFLVAYKEGIEYIIDMNLRGRRFVEYYTTLLLTRILTPFSTGFVDLQSPSGAGISGAVYDFDGSVYPADEGRMLARMGDDTFRLGNVHNDSYHAIFGGSRLRELTRASCLETLPGCAWCAYQPYCGGDPIRSYVESGDLIGHRPTSDFCKKNMGIFDYLLGLIRADGSGVMDVLWSWITNRALDSVRL